MRASIAILILFCSAAFSQDKQFLDYIVTAKNDTIYGTIRKGFFKNYLTEFDENSKSEDNRFIEHSLKDIIAYRYNDFVYLLDNTGAVESSTKDRGSFSPQIKKREFAITNANDTIFGDVSSPLFGKPELALSDGKSRKIKHPEFKAYFDENLLFEYYEKNHKVHWLDVKDAFMPVLFRKNEYTLYWWKEQSASQVYYLEIGPDLYFVDVNNFWEVVYGLFGDDDDLVKILENRIYDYDHLPLIVKYYATESVLKKKVQQLLLNLFYHFELLRAIGVY